MNKIMNNDVVDLVIVGGESGTKSIENLDFYYDIRYVTKINDELYSVNIGGTSDDFNENDVTKCSYVKIGKDYEVFDYKKEMASLLKIDSPKGSEDRLILKEYGLDKQYNFCFGVQDNGKNCIIVANDKDDSFDLANMIIDKKSKEIIDKKEWKNVSNGSKLSGIFRGDKYEISDVYVDTNDVIWVCANTYDTDQEKNTSNNASIIGIEDGNIEYYSYFYIPKISQDHSLIFDSFKIKR